MPMCHASLRVNGFAPAGERGLNGVRCSVIVCCLSRDAKGFRARRLRGADAEDVEAGQDAERALRLRLVPAVRRTPASIAERDDQPAEQPGGAPRDRAGHDEERVDAEDAEREDERHHVARRKPAIEQRARDRDVEADRHRQECADQRGHEEHDEAERHVAQQVVRQQRRHHRAEEAREQHQRHRGPDDEPEIFPVIEHEAQHRLHGVLPRRRRRRIGQAAAYAFGDLQFASGQEAAQDRHREQDDEQR